MKYLTKFKLFEDNEIDELDDYMTSLLYKHGKELIHKMIKDIQFINDKCLELDDEGYFTYCDFTPNTYNNRIKHPIIFLDIKGGDNFHSFYGNIKQRKEMVDSVITDIINYMKEEGYKEIDNFTFLNNPTSYQLRFEKINY